MFTEYLQLKKYTPNTREGIIKGIGRFVRWAENENIPVEQVSYNDVMAFIAHRRKASIKAVSIKKDILQVKHYYTFLVSVKQVRENPCNNIDIKGIKRKTLYDTFTTEELDTIFKQYASVNISTSGTASRITHKRNKIILGLIIYQGLRTQELAALTLSNVQLQEGKINVPGTSRTEGRELKLEAFQLYDLMDYINDNRKLILALSGKQTDKLFTSIGGSDNFNNITQKILEAIRRNEKRIKEIKQLRASVITNWLKVHNIRKVQYMAGHRYVSSTESYQVNNMDDLKEDVNRYYPNL